jgi:hypothetical protein
MERRSGFDYLGASVAASMTPSTNGRGRRKRRVSLPLLGPGNNLETPGGPEDSLMLAHVCCLFGILVFIFISKFKIDFIYQSNIDYYIVQEFLFLWGALTQLEIV